MTSSASAKIIRFNAPITGRQILALAQLTNSMLPDGIRRLVFNEQPDGTTFELGCRMFRTDDDTRVTPSSEQEYFGYDVLYLQATVDHHPWKPVDDDIHDPEEAAYSVVVFGHTLEALANRAIRLGEFPEFDVESADADKY